MELDDCFKKGFIKKTSKNLDLVNSLIEMSDIKEETVKTAVLNNRNVSAYVSMAYDSARQILEGICILKGYKVVNHVCLGKLLVNDIDYVEFERYRYIRNSINYYGHMIDFEQGKELIEKIFMFKDICKNYLDKKLKEN